MSEIKTIRLSGSAASELTGKKTRRKRKQDGGTNDATNAVTSAASNAGSTDTSTWLKYPEGPVPPRIVPSMNTGPSLTVGGKVTKLERPETVIKSETPDTRQIRVELKHKKKVHLNPKKPEVQKQKKTKKVRKVTIGLRTFHRRITRAKKLHKKMKDLPLDKLREKLVKDGLIKATSKAPESVLRQIASDSEVVNKKAL